jgi:hypothetical protein
MGKRGHVWLVNPDGDVVDPTRGQFPGDITYEPWEPGDEVRVGTCMQCGAGIWRKVPSLEQTMDKVTESLKYGKMVSLTVPVACSKQCEDDLAAAYSRM